MVIFYDKDKELYYQVYVSLIDVNGYWEDYEITPQFVKDVLIDPKRKAYPISHDDWETIKDEIDNWLDLKENIRSIEEEKHYSISVAIPLYEVYNSSKELVSDDCAYTLDEAKHFYIDKEQMYMEKYTVVPFSSNECKFRPRIQRWSGDY